MIERLRLKNFRRYKEETIDFVNGMNYIGGINNAGKTSLFYAIEYALFGRVGSFKSQIALLHPGQKTVGIELIFIGRDGQRYKLQRIHTLPPKSKTKIVGHYTLKKISDDGEIYMLSSDFQDREETLALKLYELLGISRRLFDVSINLKQGEISSILDGMPQLDIVLGITAAVHSANEMTTMALEREKETVNLPVFLETAKHFETDLLEQKYRQKSLEQEMELSEKKMADLEGVDHIYLETQKIQLPLKKACANLASGLTSWEKNHNEKNFTSTQLNELIEESGSLDTIDNQILEINDQDNELTQKMNQLKAELNQFRSRQSQLDLEKGDLKGRIDRRKKLPSDGKARCETCGQIIDVKLNETEIKKWSEELDTLEKHYKKNNDALQTIHTSISQLNDQLKDLGHKKIELENVKRNVTKLVNKKKEVESSLSQSMKFILESMTHALEETSICITAFDNLSQKTNNKIKSIQLQFDITSYESEFKHINTDVDNITFSKQFLEKLNHALSVLDDKIKALIVKSQTEATNLRNHLMRLKSDLTSVQTRISTIEKELASTKAKVEALKLKELTAIKLRQLANGFKDIQITMRNKASDQLSKDTFDLHKTLAAPDNEFRELHIDSKDYIVYVTPYDLNKEVPANLYQGGGHKLLLGLSFKLAIARLIGKCSFILFDEPTYGLDQDHLFFLLERLDGLGICNQMILITHHDIQQFQGNHIQIVRDKKISKKI